MRSFYSKSLSNILIETVKKKVDEFAKNETIEDSSHKEEDIFRLLYHFALEYSSAHFTKMQNYVALYGFTRTLTFLSVSFFWGFIYLSIKNWNNTVFSREIYLSILFAIISFLLYMDYMKFHRRFSQEVFMAIAVIYPERKTKKGVVESD